MAYLNPHNPAELASLAANIRQWASELGFSAVAVAEAELSDAGEGLRRWLAAGFHGSMDYMARHARARMRPAECMEGVSRVISASMPYWPDAAPALDVLGNGALGYISRYALGRDYHKVLRPRLQKLAQRIVEAVPSTTRVFTDSAPVMEVEFAQRSGLGWRGKHTLLVSRQSRCQSGSCFFLGEIFIDIPLPVDAPVPNHCGRCTACLSACPTGAIVAPYQLDARRCIAYLTIEHPGVIPEVLRPLMGNRIVGCDDCQLACPWNRFAPRSTENDFAVRHGLDGASLVSLFAWSEAEFLERTAGSPIRRVGYERWLRNIAVALGNAPRSPEIIAALQARAKNESAIVREHVAWALGRFGI
ncbi:MAG: tRNA epoxyqueuosine(34) reductase QueG [Azoarcus sp.]|jgi:epoxyqueuosine reductase|nr:tRNA epoxyqueuosine(34) reductase QueG [Azoarcus sp.]